MTSKIKIPTLYVNKKYKEKFVIEEYDKERWITILEKEIFKEPGYYNLNEYTSAIINREARKFKKYGYYTDAVYKTIDYINYWDHQKLLCRNGLLIVTPINTIYIPRDYYFWINFLPIFRKDIRKHDFADIIDFQIHLSLYEYIAELKGKHVAIVKKRQCASSYIHAAKLVNQLWFEEGLVNKIAAYTETYLNQIWQYIREYRNFLNINTGWYRSFIPDSDTSKHWKQQFEERTADGKKVFRGNKSELIGVIADTTGSKTVSGSCAYFYHEEGGISPIMLDIFEFVTPALTDGNIITGQFIAAGSVSELDQSAGLRELILNPEVRNIYAVETRFYDPDTPIRLCGLFVPEQWGMRPFIDEHGNSLVDEAIKELKAKREAWKKELPFDKYQLRVSQAPMYITEAFNYRKESRFPLDIIKIQEDRIRNGYVNYEYVELNYDSNGKIVPVPSNRMPIMEVPVKRDAEDKRGVIVVYERPLPNLPFGSYVACVDPVASGKTISSDSLATIYVYRMPTVSKSVNADGSVNSVNVVGDKVVCSWSGRYDDINDTFDNLLKIIEWYNAKTLVENNSWNFIQHVIYKQKQHYLIPSSQILFTKEINANTMTFKEYGWSMTEQMFNNHLIPYLINFVKEKIGEEYNEKKEVIRTIFGVERIPDIMALEEMKKYYELKNKDRLVTLSALVAYVKVLTSNYGYIKIQEKKDNQLILSKKNNNFNMNIWYMKNKKIPKYKSYFKNIKL